MPEPVPTVAIVVVLLLHVPPAVASLSVVVEATHALKVPAMFTGSGLTVTEAVAIALSPLPSVIVTV
jgi:hypothetical protein